MFMVNECSRLMKGTKYGGKWLFYHDTLSFLTAKETKKWITATIFENKSMMSRWLIPTNDVNKGTTYHIIDRLETHRNFCLWITA